VIQHGRARRTRGSRLPDRREPDAVHAGRLRDGCVSRQRLTRRLPGRTRGG
jgi:hypothetical protein